MRERSREKGEWEWSQYEREARVREKQEWKRSESEREARVREKECDGRVSGREGRVRESDESEGERVRGKRKWEN